MPVALTLAALLVATGATSPSEAPVPEIRILQAPPGPSSQVCRDRVHEVRDERGLPKLDGEAAKPDEALLIAAVDKRINGCSMLVMRNDTSDIRPLPTRPAGPPRLQRIPAQ